MKRNILLLIVFLCLGYFQATAQTNHNVTSSGLVFTPDSISINVGDTVTWTNTQGSHNVNGSMAKYPNNPEFFDNGAPSASLWTFQHVFTKPGLYNYQCDAHIGAGMVGKVLVGGGSMKNESLVVSVFKVYPNPANTTLTISSEGASEKVLTIYGLDGKIVLSKKWSETTNTVSLSEMHKGLYILKLEENGVLVHQQKLSKI